MTEKPTDWDAAYDNSGAVPDAAHILSQLHQRAAAFRAGCARIDVDLAYGDEPREVLDLIWPDGTPKGLVVFVHGGYWMRLSKSDWSHLAAGPLAHGYAVALPSYTLAPAARISQMTRQIGAAICCAAERLEGPIFLAGHSAGGHLVSRMACEDTPLPSSVLQRVQHIVSISGLHDLRPLLRTKMNAVLRLDEIEAARESAALRAPLGQTTLGAKITAWVGGGELPEFLTQSRKLVEAWQSASREVAYMAEGDLNHFTVVDGLETSTSDLCRCLLLDN